MNEPSRFSILVNTTDQYEDCWEPFFKLFKKYWSQFEGNIYLNTETKQFGTPELKISSIQNKLIHKTWSECLRFALNFIEEEIILYLQDDYFLNDFVDQQKIQYYADLMVKEKIDCIHLSPYASKGPFYLTQYPNLMKFARNAEYKISLQAALWQKSLLKKYLRVHENAAQFERYGTKRAWRSQEEIYNYFDLLNKTSLIPYYSTGIIKGKWNRVAVKQLFEQNDITVDFTRRGYYEGVGNSKPKITIKKIVSRIRSIF